MIGAAASLIKARRKALNLSVDDVANKLHDCGFKIAGKTLYGYESGDRQPDADLFLALCEILGIDSFKVPRPLSDEAERLARRFDALDEHGKDMIMRVIDGEEMRIEKERAKAEIVPITRKTIPLLHDVAAGPTDVFGEIMDEYEIDADSPANFAIQISGDSMEPFLPDGSVQLGIMGNGLETGDIGVFMLDGGLLCKQYVKDNYGNVYLNSLNRDRADADVTLMASGNQTVFCYGKVLTNEKIPVQM